MPVSMHTHYTSGMASMAYLKAIDAGRGHHRLLPGALRAAHRRSRPWSRSWRPSRHARATPAST